MLNMPPSLARGPGLALAWALLCVPAAPALLVAQPMPPKQASNEPPPSPEKLARWGKDLDHDVFVVREEATQKLVKAGLPAIEICRNVLKNPTAETGSRALHVLHQLALSNDVETLDAARSAIDEVTRGKSPPLKARADEILAQLNSQRQAITLGELEALGARIRRTQYSNGIVIEEVIQSLEIGNEWRGTDNDFRRLKWLVDVRQVALVGDRATDAALPHVAAMKGLRSVQAYRANITDAGIKHLASSPLLEDVGIFYIPVTNEAINSLKELKALTNARIYGTKATPEAAQELQAGLGAGKVDFRHGAFLGVGCVTVEMNCAITRVSPESPAERAGIKSDDLVLSFNGEAVPDFETLTATIAKLKAGDIAEVVIQRVGLDDDNRAVAKKMTLKVPLAEWPVDQFIMGANRE
jgi:hypothetical protein